MATPKPDLTQLISAALQANKYLIMQNVLSNNALLHRMQGKPHTARWSGGLTVQQLERQLTREELAFAAQQGAKDPAWWAVFRFKRMEERLAEIQSRWRNSTAQLMSNIHQPGNSAGMVNGGSSIMKHRHRRLPDSKTLLDQLSSDTITRFGVRMLFNARMKEWRLKDVGGSQVYHSKRECLLAYFASYGRQYGSVKSPYTLRKKLEADLYTKRQHVSWRLVNKADQVVASWLVRPNRKELANTLRRLRNSDSRPSYSRPDTLGWRTFGWHPTKHCLVSPVQGTLWDTPEMRVEDWNESSVVRGHAGIHACRLPRGDWRTAQRP